MVRTPFTSTLRNVDGSSYGTTDAHVVEATGGLASRFGRSYEASWSAVVLHAAHRVPVRRMRHEAVDPVVARRELSGPLRPDQRGEAARRRGTGLRYHAGHDHRDGGCEVAVRRLQPGGAVCAPSHRVAGFTQQVACGETRPRSKAAGRTRSVVGPGGVGRLLLDGDVERRGRAALAAVPLLAQPPQRNRVARDVPGGRGGEPAAAGIARADDRADAADQRALPLRGPGRTGCLNLWTLHRCQSQQYALARL